MLFPTQAAAVLIATVGISIPPTVIRRAVELSGGRPVAVVSIARIYGSSLGLPNPGLLPTRKEMEEQRALVTTAIDRLERSGVKTLAESPLPGVTARPWPGRLGPAG